ncbi:MAG: hypothetical protein RIG62_09055 [Cyclobacteriaceae bacterium]
MKKIIAIVTIGASTAFLQVNAQETQPKEQETQQPQQEVLDERAQPAADFEQNQYGTYPQDGDTAIISQDRVEISKSELPQEVLDGFENSDFSDMEIVAVYEVQSNNNEMEQLSDEPINDPEYDNTLNEEAETDPMLNEENQEVEVDENMQPEVQPDVTEESVKEDLEVAPEEETEATPEEQPVIESENKAEITQEENETTMATPETEAQNPAVTETDPTEEMNTESQSAEENVIGDTFADQGEKVKYEIEVKDKKEEKHTTLTFSEEGNLEETSEESSM